MHELALALNILEIATEQARAASATVIRRIEVEIGQLAGVETEALAFGFELARKGTLAEDALLDIREIAGRGRCARCGQEGPVSLPVTGCAGCRGGVEVIQGRELRVRCIDVD